MNWQWSYSTKPSINFFYFFPDLLFYFFSTSSWKIIPHLIFGFSLREVGKLFHIDFTFNILIVFARTNQPTADQLSKEGSRQPCSQSISKDKSIFESTVSHRPIVSQTLPSLFAQTNQPTADQLSKEGSRQPCSQSISKDKSIFESTVCHQPIVSQTLPSLFAQTNQPTADQLSKEGSRQPCSQSISKDKTIF